MKNYINLFIVIVLSFNVDAQITKINHYVPGTKISLYPNQCGNTIPEAEGKLSFCRGEYLGVVENSLGLNARIVNKMISNHYNDDKVFKTGEGISIQKADGTWDNIPHRAVPSNGVSTTVNQSITDALVLPNGKMLMLGSNMGTRLVAYDLNEKTLESIEIPDGLFHYPQAMSYDPDRDVTWVLCYNANNNYLYKFDDGELTLEFELDDPTASSNYNSDRWQYHNNRLFKAGSTGLTVIELNIPGDQFVETKHDYSNSGTLPMDNTQDMEIDNDGFVWVTQIQVGGNEGVVVKFDPQLETYESYSFEHPTTPGFFLTFPTIGQDRNSGVMWLVANYLGGLLSLTIEDEEPIWNHIPTTDLGELGVPYIYNVNFIHTQGDQTFFCTNSNSSASNLANEILVLEGEGEWTGINDDEPSNMSDRMLRRFQGALPDDNGGIWWLNRDDEDVVYMVDENNYLHFPNYDPLNINNACMNQNQNLVLRSQEGFGEFVPPNLIPYEESSTSLAINAVAPWANEVWAARTQSGTPQYIAKYQDGAVVQEFETEELVNYYDFAMTTDKKAVFARTFGSELGVKIFNPITEEIQEFTYPASIGQYRDVIPASDGNYWIIGSSAMVFYNGDDFELYNGANLGVSISGISNAVLDQDQNLHFIDAAGKIFTLAPPYDNFEIANTYQITGADGLMPFYPTSTGGFGQLAIDNDGDMWFAKWRSLVELERENGVPEFNVNDIVGVEELSANTFDFEMFPNPNSYRQLRIILPEDFGQSTLSIFDMQGKLIGHHQIQRSNAIVHLTDVSSGMYIVTVSNMENSVSKKLMIE